MPDDDPFDDLDSDELREALCELVDTGRITATCSQCKRTLTPEEHESNKCPTCGVFAGAREPLYFPPN
jgi:hypothetical protein